MNVKNLCWRWCYGQRNAVQCNHMILLIKRTFIVSSTNFVVLWTDVFRTLWSICGPQLVHVFPNHWVSVPQTPTRSSSIIGWDGLKLYGTRQASSSKQNLPFPLQILIIQLKTTYLCTSWEFQLVKQIKLHQSAENSPYNTNVDNSQLIVKFY